MESTAAIIARIADYLEPTWLDVALKWIGLLAALGSSAAVVVAVVTLNVDRRFRRRDSLNQLLEYFDRSRFFVRMWRMNQATHTKGSPSISPYDVDALLSSENLDVKRLAGESLSSSWQTDHADMFEVYFFALRLAAWSGSQWSRRSTRLLNDTFGHQLLTTFVHHRLVACRLTRARKKVGPSYYPTHYGLFDDRYSDLVKRLAKDILEPGRLPEVVRETLSDDLAAINRHLAGLASEQTLENPPLADQEIPDPV